MIKIGDFVKLTGTNLIRMVLHIEPSGYLLLLELSVNKSHFDTFIREAQLYQLT